MKPFVKRDNYFKMLDRNLELPLTLKVAGWDEYDRLGKGRGCVQILQRDIAQYRYTTG